MDPASRAGVLAAFGAHVEVVCWPGADELAAWEVEARIRAIDGVDEAAATVVASDDDTGCIAFVQIDGPQVDDVVAAVEEGVGPEWDVQVVAGPLHGAAAAVREARARRGRLVRPSGLGSPLAASTAAEAELLGIVDDLSTIAPVGVTDRFTDLGVVPGQAGALASAVREQSGVPVRAVELLDHATVRDVAALVEADGEARRRRPVLGTLAEGPEGLPPLFLVHDIAGSPLPLLALAGQLPVRVVGIESPLLAGGRSPFATLELMALRYLSDVCRAQPTGPYRLGGWGFGAVVAFEMARQLVAEGAEVALLAVADAGPGARPPDPPSAAIRWRRSAGAETPTVAAHRRLAAAYPWRVRQPLDVATSVGWTTDLGSEDATLGWAGVIEERSLDITRLEVPHAPEPDAAALAAWASVLTDALARADAIGPAAR